MGQKITSLTLRFNIIIVKSTIRDRVVNLISGCEVEFTTRDTVAPLGQNGRVECKEGWRILEGKRR